MLMLTINLVDITSLIMRIDLEEFVVSVLNYSQGVLLLHRQKNKFSLGGKKNYLLFLFCCVGCYNQLYPILGVEAGKKAAGEVLALQKRVLAVLSDARYADIFRKL